MDILQLPDEDLAIYVREVDNEAYREVVKRYEADLLKYAVLMVSNELTAHEVVQESFIELYRNMNAFNPKTRFSSFAFHQLHNTLREKTLKKRTDFGTYEDISELFANEDDTEHEFNDRELLIHLKRHLHQVPLKFREVLILHFMLRKSYDEIGEILKLPVSTISTRVAFGKNSIRKYEKK